MKACIFPDTVPSDDTLFPLVQVFAQVVYCQPVENEETDKISSSSLSAELIEQGRCLFRTPAPLGRDRDRFLALINDLCNRRDDYASQLSNLALAGLSSSKKEAGESKSSLIGRLLQSSGIDSARQKEKELLLWQARLLLKLGEFFDEDQADLNRELAAIKAREELLLNELRREQSDDFSLTRDLAIGTSQPDGLQKLRLKAWSRLFGLGNNPLQEVDAFISTDENATDKILDMYERRSGLTVKSFARILLPGIGKNEADMALFAQEQEELLSPLRSAILAPGQADQPLLQKHEAAWAKLLADHYPEETHGRRVLSFFYFPGIDAGTLFLETFARGENQTVPESVIADKGIVIAYLGTPQST